MSKIYVTIKGEKGIYSVMSKKALESTNVIITDNAGYSLSWFSVELVVLEKKEYPEYYL